MLDVVDLKVRFLSRPEKYAVDGVSFHMDDGEILGLVGESGSGKSVTAMAISGLLPRRKTECSGSILLDGQEMLNADRDAVRRIQGKDLSVVFQEPMTSLDPVVRIGRQVEESLRIHTKLDAAARKAAALKAMAEAELPDPEQLYRKYPHELSGGMLQRVMIAAAIVSGPKLLLADEPTTALDVTIQAQILDLLREIQQKLGTATVFVSHDLGVVARVADRVAVMYAGKIVEIGTAEEIYYDPRHPYTWGLMQALPALSRGRDTLATIPGMPPTLIDLPKGDAFACRNPYALAIDYEEEPPMFPISDTHFAATWLLDPRAPKVTPPIGGQTYG